MKIKIFAIVLLLVAGGFASLAVMPAALINANKPMLVMEYNWWDDTGFTTSAGVQIDNGETQADMCGSHDINSGYSGTVTVYSSADYMVYSSGNVNSSAGNVSSWTSTTCQEGAISILTLDDDVMWGLSTTTQFNTAGWALFQNAIDWAWDNKVS